MTTHNTYQYDFSKYTIPILILCKNNYKFLDNIIFQIKNINNEYYNNIIVINDNSNSNDEETIQYLKNIENNIKIINILDFTINNFENYEIFRYLPEKFILTNPYLRFNFEITNNFYNDLNYVSEKYKCYKTGLALDISDFKLMFQNKLIKNKNIYDWQKVNWTKIINDDKYLLFKSDMNDTLYLFNKKYFNYNFFINNSLLSVRLARNFTSKYLLWYKDISI